MTPFALVCLFVLLDHHRQGIEEAHPVYVRDKTARFLRLTDFEAFQLLDYENRSRVMAWAEKWYYAVPRDVEEDWKMTQSFCENLKHFKCCGLSGTPHEHC